MKSLLLLVFTLASASLASAADLSFGSKWNAEETPRISIRQEGANVRIRFAPNVGEPQCARWRKDFCGKTVKLIEVSAPAKSCSIQGDLIGCGIDGFNGGSVQATLESGATQTITEARVSISIGTLTQLEETDVDTFKPVTRLTLDFEIWGDRADGLDPLLLSGHPNMFSQPDFQKISKSLFDR